MGMENRYDTYKDSGIAWIGEIPEHWEVKKLGQLYLPRNEKVSDQDYPALSVTMQGVLLQLENVAKTNDGDNRKLVKIGDFAINSRSDRRGACGISKYDGSVSLINIVLTPINKMNPVYYEWLFHSSLFSDEYYKWGHGIVNDLWTTRWQEMKNIQIAAPPLQEQQSIAACLDQKCSEIDELITLQEEMITKLQSYKQSVITEAVTKGLDKNVPLKDSGIEWIGEIPEHWEVRRLKHLGKNYNGLTYSPNDICGSEDGILVLRSSNIKNNKLCFDDNVYVNKEIPQKLIVNKGDILICSRNGSAELIGKAAFIEFQMVATFGAFMMIFKGTSNIYHKYLFYIVTSCISQYKWLFTTATINQLTSSMLGEIFAPFINNNLEQQSIATYLDQKCSEIDELISIKQQKIEKLKDYKKSLIFECVTGKRKV